MKVLFVLAGLLILLASVQDSFAQSESNLSVINFNWSRYVRELAAEPEWSARAPTRQQQIDDRERQTVDRGYGDLIRSRDLRRIENKAKRQSEAEGDLFLYRIKVKSTDTKTIKSVYWEYQIFETENPDNISRREFFCWAKIKTNDVTSFQALSAALPRTKAISAKALENPKRAFSERAIINCIEYSDNSAWQRAGWDFPNPAAASLSASKRVPGDPTCIAF